VLLVTHEEEVAAAAKRIIRLRDGIVESDVAVGEPLRRAAGGEARLDGASVGSIPGS
jgi:ABC-type lipoprotein export system ATPase subunit